jgi:hypothetical protein
MSDGFKLVVVDCHVDHALIRIPSGGMVDLRDHCGAGCQWCVFAPFDAAGCPDHIY